MMSDLEQRAQTLFWAAHELEESAGPEAAREKYAELAPLHLQLADERFRRSDPGAWIDALAAITYLGKSGRLAAARRRLDEYRERAAGGGLGEVCLELDSLQSWLEELHLASDLSAGAE